MGGFGLPPTSPRKGDVLMAGEGWHITSGSGASQNWELYLGDGAGMAL